MNVLINIVIVFAAFILKVNWFVRFYTAYLLLFPHFLIVNGLLTGTGLTNPVVRYSLERITGPRILTIPLEDTFYSMNLILLNVIIYTALSAGIYRGRKARRKAGNDFNCLNYTKIL